MRIALNAVGEIGTRTGRILAAEADLVALGLYGESAGIGQDRRTIAISSLEGFDVLVTDDAPSSTSLAAIALEDGLACAVPGSVADEIAAKYEDAALPLMTDCSLAGLADTLAAHEAAKTDDPLDRVIAWTETGKPLRRGVPAAFPDPVGARWGRRVGDIGRTTRVAVPVDGLWAGATATVVGEIDGETHTRIVGVADADAHLHALALAAGAVTAAVTDQVGALHPGDVAESYLATALRMGLGVAAYTLD